MTNVGMHQARKTYPGQPPSSRIQRHIGSRLKERSASWILDDVHQKPPRSGGRPVLIVDLAVNVAPVRGRNQRGSFVLLAFGPAIEPDRLRRLVLRQTSHRRALNFHEIPQERPQIFRLRQSDSRTRAQHHQLRFNPPD